MTTHDNRLDMPDADARLLKAVFAPDEAATYFEALRTGLDWREATITLFGRSIKSPRLSAWYGDAPYSYSGLIWPARPWPVALSDIKARVEHLAGASFNGLLANLYRDGRDSMGWHADDEHELGPDPVIASVVFGASRRFQFRRKNETSIKLEAPLNDGDVLIMGAGTQMHWQHAVPKTKKTVGERINLTFRWMT